MYCNVLSEPNLIIQYAYNIIVKQIQFCDYFSVEPDTIIIILNKPIK